MRVISISTRSIGVGRETERTRETETFERCFVCKESQPVFSLPCPPCSFLSSPTPMHVIAVSFYISISLFYALVSLYKRVLSTDQDVIVA